MKTKYLWLILVLYISCTSYSPHYANDIRSWVDLGSLPYGTDSNQFVEITAPKNNRQNVNIMFYIHGYGNKMVDLTFLENYRNEFIIGKLDYGYLTPKRPDLSMNKLLSDVHEGLKTLKNTVETEGYTINKVIIMGNSLGATLTLLYAYTFFDISPVPIAFCVTMSGLTDMTDAMIVKFTERFGKRFIQKYMVSLGSILTEAELSLSDITGLGFSDTAKEVLKKISPLYYLNENVPPAIIVHNTNDKIIPFSNAMSLNHVLNVYNVPHIFIQSLTDYGHELGPNISNRNGLVFAPANARLPASTPRRYTRKLVPELEEKLIEAINLYIVEYCL